MNSGTSATRASPGRVSRRIVTCMRLVQAPVFEPRMANYLKQRLLSLLQARRNRLASKQSRSNHFKAAKKPAAHLDYGHLHNPASIQKSSGGNMQTRSRTFCPWV